MLKKALFAGMFLGVLSASAMSFRQLRTDSHQIAACGASCSATVICGSPCFICLKPINGSTGICVRRD